MSQTPNQPQISVIIPVYNGGDDLAKCLQGVYASKNVSFECIVVDDASTDGRAKTESVRSGARLIRLDQQGGPAHARNVGAKVASANVLFFTDADVVLQPDTLAQALHALQQRQELAAVFGSYDDNPGHRSFLSRYRNLYHHWTHQKGNEEASTFWSGCGAIRKDVFDSVGGFNAEFQKPSIEDIEMGYRLLADGHRINLVAAMQCQHLKQWTFMGMLKTDIFQRGVPWVALLQRFPGVPSDLNISPVSRLCTLFAVLLVVCLMLLIALQPFATVPFFAFLAACLLAQGLWKLWPGPSAWSVSVLAAILLILAPSVAYAWRPSGFSFLPLLLTAGIVAMQAPFYRLVARREGLTFAIACVPQQILFFLACAVSVPLGLLSHWSTPSESNQRES